MNETSKEANSQPPNQLNPQVSNLLKQEKIERIAELKNKIDTLINNIRDSKSVCDKYESEIQYFQEYIGGLMKSDNK